ncbi:hypothetical protein [Herbidospora sp. NBRC 101105]|uniref:hypothetical protein n=1 Tax=Herbidospora sp. NBRC 101105 TaxID=3032195 RepID=UPI0025529F54|nr:hypothetical protein [Herbidospora sp. NBRC 101105]
MAEDRDGASDRLSVRNSAAVLRAIATIRMAIGMIAGVLNRGHVMVINVVNLFRPEWGCASGRSFARWHFSSASSESRLVGVDHNPPGPRAEGASPTVGGVHVTIPM